MIDLKPMRGGKRVTVTFMVADDLVDGQSVAVVGDFNQWDPAANPLARDGGVRSAKVTLPAGGRYAFRYLTDTGQWFNDTEAHGYEGNDVGGENSVLDLSRPS